MTGRNGSRGRRGESGRGAFKYRDYRDNHVVGDGRQTALKEFVEQNYRGLKHKLANAHSSNSEDALTWSCFDALRHVPRRHRNAALSDLWELAFGNRDIPTGVENGEIGIGKTYGDSCGSDKSAQKECTEVDVSIEGPGALVFFEAKLYSPMSQADHPKKPHDQIARKIRVGIREAQRQTELSGRHVDFFFIVLDIAPPAALRSLRPGVTLAQARAKAGGFAGKWTTAYWFERYKAGRNGSLTPLKKILADAPAIERANAAQIAQQMGWLTWSDVFKAVLRAVIEDRVTREDTPA